MSTDDQLERRDALKLFAFGAAAVGGYVARGGSLTRATAGGGGRAPVSDGVYLGGSGGGGGDTDSSSTGGSYQIDVATSLGAIPATETKPHFIFVVGSNHEKGSYVNVDTVPAHVVLDGFELVVADALADVPGRETPIQFIAIRTGAEKGTYVDYASKPSEAGDDTMEIAVADALADIATPGVTPDLNLVPASGAAKGSYVNTGA